MLLERISHYHNLHFSIDFSNVACEAPHYHKETEIALLLKGTAKYKIYHQDYFLKAGDIIIVDGHDLHYIYESSSDAVFLTSYIDMSHFDNIFPNIDFMIFACEEFSDDPSVSHQKIQNKIAFIAHHLADIMILTDSGTAEDDLLKEKLLDIINTMVNHLQGFFIENNEFRYGGDDVNPLNLQRLARIISYLYTNYDRNITLADLAELEHLSIYHISHLIKETSGLSFQKLLNYIRLEYAEKLLNDDKTTLTQISELCGFSSPAYFNKCFREWYNMTPAQYRKQPRPSSRTFHGDINRDAAMDLLVPYTESKPYDNSACSFSRQINISEIYDVMGSKKIKEIFPLDILIASSKEMEYLLHYKKELMELLPRSISATETVMSDPETSKTLFSLERSGITISERGPSQHTRCINACADTPAEAMRNISDIHAPYIRLSGKDGSLFTDSGIPTPYYTFYRAVSSADGIFNINKGYITVISRTSVSIIIYNDSAGHNLKSHIMFNDNNLPPYIIQKTFSWNKSVLSAVDSNSDQLSDHRIKKLIFESASGFSEVNPPSCFSHNRYDITVSQGDIVIVTFENPY